MLSRWKANQDRSRDDLPLKHPFRLLMLGRSRSGKTTTLINLLINKKLYYQQFDEVYIFSKTFWLDGKWRNVKIAPERVKTSLKLEYLRAIIANIQKDPHKNRLIVIDDCASEADFRKQGHQNEIDELAMLAFHLNCSIITTAQNKTSVSTPTRSNADGVVIFEPDNQEQLKEIYKEFGLGTQKEFNQIVSYATRIPYSFLFINRQGPKRQYFRNFTFKLHIQLGSVQTQEKAAPTRYTAANTEEEYPDAQLSDGEEDYYYSAEQ